MQVGLPARKVCTTLGVNKKENTAHLQGVSQLLKQSDWAQIQDFK